MKKRRKEVRYLQTRQIYISERLIAYKIYVHKVYMFTSTFQIDSS